MHVGYGKKSKVYTDRGRGYSSGVTRRSGSGIGRGSFPNKSGGSLHALKNRLI